MKRTICIILTALSVAFSCYGGNVGLKVVVIDAGHGGKDPGAVSADGKTYEKTITLDIANRLADKIRAACPDVKVIQTRKSDKFVSLNDRAMIANKADADLFISIHINAADNRNANGYSVHLMGQSSKKNTDLYEYNLNVCKRENSVIKLEEDYSTTYEGFDPDDAESMIFMQLMQSAHLEQSMSFAEILEDKMKSSPFKADRGVWQNPFYVLWKTAMPSALVELGFISNKKDLEVLRNASDREAIASCLFTAFTEYKAHYDRTLGGDSDSASAGNLDFGDKGREASQESPSSEVRPNDIRYGVQIFAGATEYAPDAPEFMGYEVMVIPAGKIKRYVIGLSSTLEEARSAQSEIKKKYKDCYIVKIDR